MTEGDFYSGFDEAQQAEYETQAAQRWGAELVNESSQRWKGYNREQKNRILGELNEINNQLVTHMGEGFDSPQVQEWIQRWHLAINTHFYPCSLEVFEALGHGYVADPQFSETYEKMAPGMAAFMEQAMSYYCQEKRLKTH